MSSRNSHKSRSSSKSRTETNNDYGPAQNEEKKDGFFPMLAGMTVSLMLIFWIISLFNPPTQQQKEASQNSQIDDVAVALNSTNFDQFLKDANPEQLVERLNDIKQAGGPGTTQNLIFDSQQRVAIAKQLLKSSNLPPDYRTFAKLQWLSAQRTIYGVDFMGRLNSQKVVEEFKACYTRFLNDTDPKVYLEAHLSRLSYYLFESIKGKQPVSVLLQHLQDILDRFPDQEEVVANIRLQFMACIESDRAVAKELAEQLSRSDQSKSQRTSQFVQFVLDHYQILQLNYSDMFANRFINGDAGLRELEKASLTLLDNPESGDLIVDEVAQVAYWFEQSRYFDHANRIFQGMIDAGKTDRKIPNTQPRLTRIGNAGIARIKRFGTKIPLSGTTMTGKTINPGEFINRIVLGVFFDPDDPLSIRLLNKIEKTADAYATFGTPIRVVAVPSTSGDFEQKLSVGLENSRILFLAWQDNRPPELANVYPVVDFPHLMALDHRGILVRINLSPDRFETEIERLVDQR